MRKTMTRTSTVLVIALMLAGFVGCESAQETVIRMERSPHDVAGANDGSEEIVAPERSSGEVVPEVVTEESRESPAVYDFAANNDLPVTPTPSHPSTPPSTLSPGEDEPAMSVAIAPQPPEESSPTPPVPVRAPVRECTMDTQCRTGESCGYVDGVRQCTILLTAYQEEVTLVSALCFQDSNCPSGQTCHFVDGIKQCAVPLNVYREPAQIYYYREPVKAYREPVSVTW